MAISMIFSKEQILKWVENNSCPFCAEEDTMALGSVFKGEGESLTLVETNACNVCHYGWDVKLQMVAGEKADFVDEEKFVQ